MAKYGGVYTRRRAEGLRVTYHKVVDAGVEYRLVTAGGFAEAAEEVERRLAERGFVVVKGSRGIGKSTLAAYVAYDMLKKGDVDYVVKVKSPVDVSEVDVFKALGRRALLFFDIYPREVYLEQFDPRRPLRELYGSVEALLSLATLTERSREVGAGLYALAVVHDKALAETHRRKAVREWLEGASFYDLRLNTPEFLAGVLKSYACPNEDDCCLGKVDTKRLVDLISSHDAYTLVAKYAGLWLKEKRCDAEKLEEALKSSLKPSKAEPKLYLAHYIWHVLLRGSGNLTRKAAVPLLLHARFGPVPVGVTYVTKAAYEGGRWRLSTPEGLEGAVLRSLKKDALEPIADWLAQLHEDLVEEALEDLAGLNGEEAREPYKETLSGLMEALDWARGEVLKEGDKVLAELGIQEKGRGLGTALLLFVARRLAAVFKSDENRRCWKRVALIAGHALAGYPKLPKRKQFPKGVAKTLGDSLRSCAVDSYLMIDGKIPPLSIYVVRFPYYVEVLYARDLSRIRKIREKISVLSPLADTVAVNTVKKTAEELLARWRRGGSRLAGAFYVSGLAALAAEAKVDGKTAKLLLYVAPFAIQGAAHSAAVLSVLAALRPLGEKAPHRYVVALTAASELGPLGQKTVQYIYDALRQFKDRLLKTKRFWPLVEAIVAYSNLLRNHSAHIKDRWKEIVADMCRLYGEVRRRNAATTPDSGLSAQRLLDAVARAYVLAVALESYDLALHVKDRCGLSDFEREAEAVRSVLDKAAARPEELKKIMENEDFADWVRVRNITRDAGFMARNFRSWFMYVLTRYKLSHALDDKGELDEKKLEETAEEFEKVADMRRELEDWGNYLTARGQALKARVLVAKNLEGLLEEAKGFWELWSEAEEHLEPTAINLATAAFILGECLVYLAASGNKEMAEELLKKSRWLLDYDREVSVVTRLMLRVLGMGEGARQEEVVDVFKPRLSPKFRPALLMLAGPLQKDEALEECDKLSNALPPKPEACVNAVAAAAGNREAAEMLRSVLRSDIEELVSEARLLLGKADGRTLVEVLAPIHSLAQFAFTLLAAVEGGSTRLSYTA